MTKTTYSTHVLEQLKGDFTCGIEQFVINDLESYDNDWYTHLQDIINHGCVSGTVSSLIYYNQTIAFHDEHEDEIDDLIEEYLENTGETFADLVATMNFEVFNIDLLKNWKAWFAYEFVASNINRALEDDLYEDLEKDVASFLDNMIMVDGFEYDEHKQIAIDIFESIEETDNEIDLENERMTQDVNLHSLIETLLYNGFSMEDIDQQTYFGNISFSFNTETGMHILEVQ